MKKLMLTLSSVLVMLCANFNAFTQEKPKEMFREETMRKFSVNNTAVQLEKGTVWVFDYGDVKVHAYETKDFFDTSVLFMEKKGKGVLIEVPPVSDNWEELIDYIVSLGHKSIEVMVSYHPIGAKFLESNKLKFTQIYSMQHAVDNYVSGAGAQSLPALKQQIGDSFDETVFTKATMLEEGVHTIAGIKMEISNVDFAFDVIFPELNAVHLHMLSHDRHALIFSLEFLDTYIAQLEGYQTKGYDIYFPAHGVAESLGDVTIKLNYLRQTKEIIASSSSKENFLANMNKAFPGYGWSFYLQGTANFLFQK